MFIRILGRIFFLFYICPFLRNIFVLATRVTIKKANAYLKEENQKIEAERARSRSHHPAGSRLPRP